MKNHLNLIALLLLLLATGCGTGSDRAPTQTALPPTEAIPPTGATSAPTIALAQRTETTAAATAEAKALPPGPACAAPAALTPPMTEGPYYTVDSPERTSLLEPGMGGTKVLLTGFVLDENCQPVANAWLDFWQTDAEGVYDNEGYRLRGHQFTDAEGRYQLETVIPGIYPGRTAHIHVKVRAPEGPELTTQLFFPGEAQNDRDRIFDPALLVTIQSQGETVQAAYNFIVSTP